LAKIEDKESEEYENKKTEISEQEAYLSKEIYTDKDGKEQYGLRYQETKLLNDKA
jgi:hypothetical protein